jgi:hypothetical protein
MKLEGSCHCGAVTFTVDSHTPYPFNRCYCTKCRKGGGAGYTVNIMGDASTLKVEGADNITVYRSANNHRGAYEADGLGYSRKHFCKTCGSPLYIFNPQYPDWVYPCATAIDTDLPEPPAVTNLMLGYKASWAPVSDGPDDKHFEFYPDEGIEDWHRRRGLYRD